MRSRVSSHKIDSHEVNKVDFMGVDLIRDNFVGVDLLWAYFGRG